MIVNERLARLLSPDRTVVGLPFALTFRFSDGDVPFGTRTIVAVVGDAIQRSPREPVGPAAIPHYWSTH